MFARVSPTSTVRPETVEEKVVWYYLLSTYGFYVLGAQYITTWFLAWGLAAYLAWRWWWPVVVKQRSPARDMAERIRIPTIVWVWIVAMAAMLVPIVVGHVNFQLGLGRTIASAILWSREWPLFALFPFIGCFYIRPQIIYRGVCILCLQSLLLAPICYGAAFAGLPDPLYVSPLQVAGGPLQYYTVSLFSMGEGGVWPRLELFTPWGPALGCLGAMYFFLANRDPDPRWRWIGRAGALLMVVSSVSRLSVVALPLAAIGTWYLVNMARPAVLIASAVGCFGLGAFGPLVLGVLEAGLARFHALRASSSNVRDTLNRVGLYRWFHDAPIWGHGLPAPGLPITADMPIGSHNTWVGLLFKHGIVGCTIFAIPVAWSAAHLLLAARHYPTARVALATGLVMLMFMLSETIEGLAYLYWPILILFGIAFRESMVPRSKLVPPVREPLPQPAQP